MKKFITILYCMGLCLGTANSQSIQLTTADWQQDLRFLQQTVHTDFPFLFKKVSAAEFDEAVNTLHGEIPELKEHEILVGFARIIALFKYGHTWMELGEDPFPFRRFPFNLYEFSDGIFIEGTHSMYPQALGAKVISVGGVPLDKALTAVYPVVPAENPQYFKAHGINTLRVAEVLHAQGVTQSLTDTLTLGLEKEGIRFKVLFKALAPGRAIPTNYGFIRREGEWLSARDSSETPLYLKHLDRHYFYEYLPDSKTVYVRYSQVLPDDSEDIPTFFNRVFDFVDENEVSRLVLDLRLNGGGNNYNNKEVIRQVIQSEKIDQVGKFYVILGRRTFSACQNLVSELDTYTHAIFIGEPTSENVNFYGDNRKVLLPHSGLALYLSFAWWQDKPQWEDRQWTAPHVAADMSFKEYQANGDPILKTALEFDATGFIMDPMDYMTELYRAGEMEKLVSETRKMIGDPRYKFYDFESELNLVGERILFLGRGEEAIGIFTFVTTLFPESAESWKKLAESYEQVGKPDLARENYEKAFSLEPDSPAGQYSKEKLAGLQGKKQ